MERNRFQILFFLRKSRKNSKGEFPIYLRVTINGKNATASTGEYVPAKYWNQKKSLVRSTYASAESINNILGKMQEKITSARSILMDERKTVDALSILKIVQGKHERNSKLIEIYSNHNMMMESMLGNGYAASYYKNHKSTKKHRIEFLQLKFNMSDIPINEVDRTFISSFVQFLRTQKNNNQNGAMKNLVRLKKIIRIAYIMIG